MSSNLYWRPVERKDLLPKELKRKLEKHCFPLHMDSSDLEYLRGLSDCEINGAKELIGLINKYDKIELIIED